MAKHSTALHEAAAAAPDTFDCGDPSFQADFIDPRQYHLKAAARLREQKARQAAWQEAGVPGTLDY